MKMLNNQIMDDGSHLILLDRPEDRSLPSRILHNPMGRGVFQGIINPHQR